MIITHQMQPTYNSCVSACIAMILDVPVSEIIDDFHYKYHDHKDIPSHYMRRKGLPVKSLLAESADMMMNKIYGLIVPSLNIEAGTHLILMEIDDNDNVAIYDPAYLREDKRYYVYNKIPDTPSEVLLKCFVAEFEIDRDDLIEWRELND